MRSQVAPLLAAVEALGYIYQIVGHGGLGFRVRYSYSNAFKRGLYEVYIVYSLGFRIWALGFRAQDLGV